MRAKGFTLIEFILYFALIAIVISGVTIFALDIVRTRAKAAVIAEVEQNMRLGLQKIMRSVRQAESLNVGASTFDSDSGALSLDMISASSTPTVFDLSGGALRLKEGAGPAVPLTTPLVNVTKLRFSRDNLGSNGVAITAAMDIEFLSANPDTVFTYSASASATAVIRKD